MNKKNFEEQVNVPDSGEQNDQAKNSSGADSDSSIYKGSVLAGLVQQTPLGRGFVAVEPTDEMAAHDDASLSDVLPSNAPQGEPNILEGVISTNVGSVGALLNYDEATLFRTRWSEIQGKFVDEPRSAVQQADALVSEVIEKLTAMFADEHTGLEGQWKEGNDVSTEDLRQALQHYRSFFNRLVV